MNFQGLKNVETPDTYLDQAFSTAKKKADILREAIQGTRDTRIEKSRKIEIEKVKTIRGVLSKQLGLILHSFPSIDSLPEFYNELVRNTLEYDKLKKALGAINWASDSVSKFSYEYMMKMKKCRDPERINGYRREYYGRISSLLKQIKSNLEYLEHSRKIMKDYPTIKTDIFTVCIAGFPNVGKTTLLSKITGAKAEVNDYAFTTRRLNTGYHETDYGKVQFIDTPGTLNRLDKMNYIEKLAYLAVNYCADVLVYVYDLTEPYPLKAQQELLAELKKSNKDIMIYISKTDILEKQKVDDFLKRLRIKTVYTDIDKLMDAILAKQRTAERHKA